MPLSATKQPSKDNIIVSYATNGNNVLFLEESVASKNRDIELINELEWKVLVNEKVIWINIFNHDIRFFVRVK